MQAGALAAVIAVPVIIAFIFIGVVIYIKESDSVRKELGRATHDDIVLRESQNEIDHVVDLVGGVANLTPAQRRRWEAHQAYLAAVERAKQERLRAAGPADARAADAWRNTGY